MDLRQCSYLDESAISVLIAIDSVVGNSLSVTAAPADITEELEGLWLPSKTGPGRSS